MEKSSSEEHTAVSAAAAAAAPVSATEVKDESAPLWRLDAVRLPDALRRRQPPQTPHPSPELAINDWRTFNSLSVPNTGRNRVRPGHDRLLAGNHRRAGCVPAGALVSLPGVEPRHLCLTTMGRNRRPVLNTVGLTRGRLVAAGVVLQRRPRF